MNKNITVRTANLNDPHDAAAVVELVDLLASWPEDSGNKLSDEVRCTLVAKLREVPGAFVLLAVSDRPVGVAVCFQGFSTFHARPVINIHDLVVRPESRGQGVGRLLLDRVEEEARKRECCRITLEVNENNESARQLYERCGFGALKPGDPMQHFMAKRL